MFERCWEDRKATASEPKQLTREFTSCCVYQTHFPGIGPCSYSAWTYFWTELWKWLSLAYYLIQHLRLCAKLWQDLILGHNPVSSLPLDYLSFCSYQSDLKTQLIKDTQWQKSWVKTLKCINEKNSQRLVGKSYEFYGWRCKLFVWNQRTPITSLIFMELPWQIIWFYKFSN